MKIYAPNKQYNGTVGTVTFKDGVATVDEEQHARELGYFRKSGYGIGELIAEGAEADELPIDFPAEFKSGTPLRDAAVDPKPDDFLAPINAGKFHPHSPKVVSPEIHDSGPAGIKPGDAHVGEPAAQEQAETAHAHAILMDHEEHPSAPDDADRGPIGLSDPGSVAMGKPDTGEAAPIKRSDSKASWVAYAIANGADETEAQGMTRAALIEKYGQEG